MLICMTTILRCISLWNVNFVYIVTGLLLIILSFYENSVFIIIIVVVIIIIIIVIVIFISLRSPEL